MNSSLRSAIGILVVSAAAVAWGYQYRQDHAIEGAMGMIFGGQQGIGGTYAIAGWVIGIGILAFLVGVGFLTAGLVQLGSNKPADRTLT